MRFTVHHTAVHEYALKPAYYTVEKECGSHQDSRRPKNRNPLRQVAVKLLPSTPCSMTLLNNRSSLTSITSSRHDGVTSVPPSSSCSLKPPSTTRLFPAQRILGWPCFKEEANLLRKNAAACHQAAPARTTSPQTNARHDSKNGQARG